MGGRGGSEVRDSGREGKREEGRRVERGSKGGGG